MRGTHALCADFTTLATDGSVASVFVSSATRDVHIDALVTNITYASRTHATPCADESAPER